jgi:hypothetical protein
MLVADVINSVGVSLILIAFFLLTLKKVDAQNVYYNLLNLIGAGLACYGSYLIKSVPFVVLEAIWSLVALYGLIRRK